MPVSRRLFFVIFTLLVCVALLPAAARAQNARESAAELARRIVAAVGPMRPLTLTLRNVSSLGAGEFTALARVLESELASDGMRLGETAEGAAEARVTLSENLRGFLWVAEVVQGEKRDVVMQGFAARERVAAAPPSVALRIEKTLLWEQESPILDAALTDAGGAPQLLVLEPGRLALYRREGEKWQAQVDAPIARQAAWPRDVRGRIEMERGVFTVYLPGLECGGVASPRLSMECREVSSDESIWTLRFEKDDFLSARFDAQGNAFDGTLFPNSQAERRVSPFFSAAIIPSDSQGLFLLAGTDGKARLYGAAAEPEAEFASWGSELVVFRSECAESAVILATGPGDWQQADILRVLHLEDRDAVVAGPSVSFSGPVTALWTAETNNGAVAVARNLKTARYEAYSITIACGR